MSSENKTHIVSELYPLQPKQQEFARNGAIYRLFGGAKWWWKSYACRAECVRQSLSRPWIHGLALRRTLPEIFNNMTQPMMQELIRACGGQKPFDYNDNKKTLTFHNHHIPEMRSKITFWYCSSKKDLLRYQGVEYDYICIEELTHRSEERFRELMWSKRSTKKWVVSNFFWSTNPWNIWHMRVKRLFVDRDFSEFEEPNEYAFIPANVYDNAVLMKTDPWYINNLRALPEKLRRAYMEWDRSVFAWQYFTEFRQAVHVIEPFVPRIWVKKRIICLDYWYKAPSAVYRMAQMNDDTVVIYRELYVTEHTYKQLALKILANTPEDEDIHTCIVDPAIVNKSSETSWSTGEQEMRSVWLRISGADNNRIKWRNNVRQYLNIYEDPNSKEMTAMLKICSNCKNLIRTLPMLQHDERNVEDLNTKQEDHSADAVRYWLLYLGEKTVSLTEVTDVNQWFITEAAIKATKSIEERYWSNGWWWMLDQQF